MQELLKRLLSERLAGAEQATGQSQDSLVTALVSSMLDAGASGGAEEESRERHADELAAARRRIRRLEQDLAAVDVMLAYIAGVFGACPVCWGRDVRCSRCRGTGAPGSDTPAERELLDWVEPALARVGLRVVRVE